METVDEFVKKLALREHFELRAFQVKAALNAVHHKRSLVVMPTAMGKTFVALLAMARVLHDKPEAKMLFLTPTKPLALQQAKQLEKSLLTQGPVVVLTGEVAPAERTEEYRVAQIVCATPQVIENDVLTSRVKLSDFVLIVFDEVHRSVGNYAYAFLARESQKQDAYIIGLTASPSSEREKLQEILDNLGAKHIEVRSEKDEDVAGYAKPVKMEFVLVDLPPEFARLRGQLEEILRESLERLKQSGFLASASVRLNKRDLLEARAKILQAARTDKRVFSSLSEQARALNVLHAIDLLEAQGLSALRAFLENLNERKEPSKAVQALSRDVRIQLVRKEANELVATGLNHPKVERLKKILAAQLESGQKAIVFAHFRDSVDQLFAELAAAGIKAEKLVGRGNEGMNQKEQAAVLDRFRGGEFNVLVATQVAEEGLSIPEVDLVVFYEAVPSEIRLIQRRGRTGRVRAGKAIVLVTKNTKDEAFLWIARRREAEMNAMLRGLSKNGINEASTKKLTDF